MGTLTSAVFPGVRTLPAAAAAAATAAYVCGRQSPASWTTTISAVSATSRIRSLTGLAPFRCMVAVESEIRGGSLAWTGFLKESTPTRSSMLSTIKALRVRRLKLGAAQVPAQLLVAVLRALGYSRLKELTARTWR